MPRAQAQQQQPNLHMLLNLDLFAQPNDTENSNSEGDAGSSGDSMLEQIRTLQALGYLKAGGGSGGMAQPPPLNPPPADDSQGDQPPWPVE
ncbi:MAG TPA: hypothetical protein VJN94_13355 [Candidatus Binataceae bacterium]|nr:hypothetical protein [Candidatus Binataceae bacterium]